MVKIRSVIKSVMGKRMFRKAFKGELAHTKRKSYIFLQKCNSSSNTIEMALNNIAIDNPTIFANIANKGEKILFSVSQAIVGV